MIEIFKVINIMTLLNSFLPDGSGELFTWIMFAYCILTSLVLAGLFLFGKEMFIALQARMKNCMIGEIPLKTGKKILVLLDKRAESYRTTFGHGDTATDKEWKIIPGSFRSYESGVWYTILHPNLPNSISLDQLSENTLNNSEGGVMTPDEIDSATKIHARRMALRMTDPSKMIMWMGLAAILCIFIVGIWWLSSNVKPQDVHVVYDTVTTITTTTLGQAPAAGVVH